MPEVRERDPSDFIKPRGKGKHWGKKDSIVPRLANAVWGKEKEHESKKEQANEYAVGVTEEAAVEVAIRAKNMPGEIMRTTQQLQPKRKNKC